MSAILFRPQFTIWKNYKCPVNVSHWTKIGSESDGWRIQSTSGTLSHKGRDKIAASFQTTFSNAFSWMKIYKFRLRFHLNFFPSIQITIFHHCFRKWLGAGQATSHYLNQWWLVDWRVYASLGLNELSHWSLGDVAAFSKCNFKIFVILKYMWYHSELNANGLYSWWVNIGSGNVLEPWGNKPLPEPISTLIYVTIWHHLATMSYQTEVYQCMHFCAFELDLHWFR